MLGKGEEAVYRNSTEGLQLIITDDFAIASIDRYSVPFFKSNTLFSYVIPTSLFLSHETLLS
jgi:hypothetical protein